MKIYNFSTSFHGKFEKSFAEGMPAPGEAWVLSRRHEIKRRPRNQFARLSPRPFSRGNPSTLPSRACETIMADRELAEPALTAPASADRAVDSPAMARLAPLTGRDHEVSLLKD